MLGRHVGFVAVLILILVAAGHAWSPVDVAEADFPAGDLSTSLLFDCLPDSSVRVGFKWQTYGQGPQWLDLSLNNDNFASLTFLGMGPLPAHQSALTWDGLAPATWYFSRINTFTSSGWQASRPMAFRTPEDCRFLASFQAYYPPPPPPECLGLPPAAPGVVAGCVWTAKDDYGSYGVGEQVVYCYTVNQPMHVRIIALKPDRTSMLVADRFDSGTGACVGPYQANVPYGMRAVAMYGGPAFSLLSGTHFFVR